MFVLWCCHDGMMYSWSRRSYHGKTLTARVEYVIPLHDLYSIIVAGK